MSGGDGDDMDQALRERLLLAFREICAINETDNFESDKEEFIFHMSGWLGGTSRLYQLWSEPTRYSPEEILDVLQGLFFHDLPHLLAAAELYDDAPEIYEMLTRRRRRKNP